MHNAPVILDCQLIILNLFRNYKPTFVKYILYITGRLMGSPPYYSGDHSAVYIYQPTDAVDLRSTSSGLRWMCCGDGLGCRSRIRSISIRAAVRPIVYGSCRTVVSGG